MDKTELTKDVLLGDIVVTSSVRVDIQRLRKIIEMLMERLNIKYTWNTMYLLDEEDTYRMIVDNALRKSGWEMSTEYFYQLFPFHKKEGYSVRGITFANQGIIVINMQQIKECVQEYEKYFALDDQEKRRDRRYFVQDSHYDDFEQYMHTHQDVMNFLFWNTILEQIRFLQQQCDPTLDLCEFLSEYQEESSLYINDMIGFAKWVYKNCVYPLEHQVVF